MKIEVAFPPNYPEIKKKFKLSGTEKIVFTYGDTLFNPTNGEVSENLLAHEHTHTQQQKDNPTEWWNLYLENDDFRLEQEIEAYRAQYNFVKKQVKQREIVNKFLRLIAGDLSSSMYGNIISFNEALKLIKK